MIGALGEIQPSAYIHAQSDPPERNAMNNQQREIFSTADNLLENARIVKDVLYGKGGEKLDEEDKQKLLKVISELLDRSDKLYDSSLALKRGSR